MKVKIEATYTWITEVSDDDLNSICEDNMTPDEDGKFDEDQLDQALSIWKDDLTEALESDASNVADDADCTVEYTIVS